MDDLREKFAPVRSLYQEAESAIHSLGIESTGIDAVAINELRYGGQHVLKAIAADNPEAQDKEIARAKSHCERAIYDAYDGAVFYELRRFQKFKQDYETVAVIDIAPNYLEICARMKRAKQLLEKARQDSDTREQYYSEITEKHKELRECAEVLEVARDELNKRLSEKSTSDSGFLSSRSQLLSAR